MGLLCCEIGAIPGQSELFLASGMRNWSVNRANGSGSRFDALPDSNHVTRVVADVTGLIIVRPGRGERARHIKMILQAGCS